MSWNIKPSLLVLWGVCWMFYGNQADAPNSPHNNVSAPEWETPEIATPDQLFAQDWDDFSGYIHTVVPPATANFPTTWPELYQTLTFMPYSTEHQELDFGTGIVPGGIESVPDQGREFSLPPARNDLSSTTQSNADPYDAFNINLGQISTGFCSPPLQNGPTLQNAAASTSANPQAITSPSANHHVTSLPSAHPAAPRQKSYRCTINNCALVFARKADLSRHIGSVHGSADGSKQHFCEHKDCERGEKNGKGFARKDGLREHVKRMHGTEAQSENGMVSNDAREVGIRADIGGKRKWGAELNSFEERGTEVKKARAGEESEGTIGGGVTAREKKLSEEVEKLRKKNEVLSEEVDRLRKDNEALMRKQIEMLEKALKSRE